MDNARFGYFDSPENEGFKANYPHDYSSKWRTLVSRRSGEKIIERAHPLKETTTLLSIFFCVRCRWEAEPTCAARPQYAGTLKSKPGRRLYS